MLKTSTIKSLKHTIILWYKFLHFTRRIFIEPDFPLYVRFAYCPTVHFQDARVTSDLMDKWFQLHADMGAGLQFHDVNSIHIAFHTTLENFSYRVKFMSCLH